MRDPKAKTIRHHLPISDGPLYRRSMKQDASAILDLARSRIIRPRDLNGLKVSRQVLAELVESGELVRTARGLYVAADFDLTEPLAGRGRQALASGRGLPALGAAVS